MPNVEIIQADAFTSVPFAGNPAAVALFERGALPDDTTLQAIALEMNLSETAYPVRRDDGDWDLRWFTPAAEVDMCGHATLATAHVLSSTGRTEGQIRFHTRSGVLTCEPTADGIVMDFPSMPVAAGVTMDGVAEALGVEVIDHGVSFDVLAQLASPEAVAAFEPDLAAIATLDTRAVIITAAGDVDGGDADFISRVFGPRVGVPEDPVTGSAHTILAPWWADRLDRTEFRAHQASQRGGRLGVKLNGDRVELSGQAVTTMTGTLHL